MLLKMFALGALSIFLVKILVFGGSLDETSVAISLMVLMAYAFFIEEKKEPEVNKEVKDRIVELETSLAETKGKLGAITLATQLNDNRRHK